VTRGPQPRPATERFWPKVAVTETCWNWTGARQAGGYGRFAARKGHLVLAHRWSYEAAVGPIPPDMTIDHLCRNTSCVRPDHLEVVTREENALRGSRNAAKTHCDRGHEFTPENTYVPPSRDHRACRECRRLDYLKRRAA
jgi:hypothetical protein